MQPNDSAKTLQTLNPLIESLVKNFNAQAILCYGSYAQGTYDDKSDIDLLIIVDETPEPHTRKKSYEAIQAKNILLQKANDNWENAWSPINDEFIFNNKKIEIGYNTSIWVKDIVKKVIQGKTTLDNFQFRPYTFLGLLENSVCLFEYNDFISDLKKQIRPYPLALKAQIIQENMSIFNESLADLEDFTERDIGVLAYQFMLFRGLDAAIQILFAINDAYYPASKREEIHLMVLPKLPDGFHKLIHELLPEFYKRKQEIIRNLKVIQLFIRANG